jgi:hypothetical protein
MELLKPPFSGGPSLLAGQYRLRLRSLEKDQFDIGAGIIVILLYRSLSASRRHQFLPHRKV